VNPSEAFAILGLSPNASDEEIKSAFRKAAHWCHPDKNPANKVAEETFKRVSEAYEFLLSRKSDSLRTEARKEIVREACNVVRQAMSLVPEGARGLPALCIEQVDAWMRGEATSETIQLLWQKAGETEREMEQRQASCPQGSKEWFSVQAMAAVLSVSRLALAIPIAKTDSDAIEMVAAARKCVAVAETCVKQIAALSTEKPATKSKAGAGVVTGAIAGALWGGPVGAAVGAAVGGVVGSRIKSKKSKTTNPRTAAPARSEVKGKVQFDNHQDSVAAQGSDRQVVVGVVLVSLIAVWALIGLASQHNHASAPAQQPPAASTAPDTTWSKNHPWTETPPAPFVYFGIAGRGPVLLSREDLTPPHFKPETLKQADEAAAKRGLRAMLFRYPCEISEISLAQAREYGAIGFQFRDSTIQVSPTCDLSAPLAVTSKRRAGMR
jgi:hypothetical protein